MSENATNGSRIARSVKHVAITVSAPRADSVRLLQQQLADLAGFAADGARLPEGARFIGMQENKMIFEVPDAG
jgi:hypothetical protein